MADPKDDAECNDATHLTTVEPSLVGHSLHIVSGAHRGTYQITKVVSSTSVTIRPDTWFWRLFDGVRRFFSILSWRVRVRLWRIADWWHGDTQR